MNQLSEMLQERADRVHDDELDSRAAAVHGRIRVVRRRRAAGVVAAAVIAVAGVVGLNLHPEQPQVTPSGRPATLVGRDVPTTVQTNLGTFTYVRGFEAGDGRLSQGLTKSDQPRVVRVATQGHRGTVSLATNTDEPRVFPAGDFGYATDGLADASATWRVRSSTGDPVGMAVYELSSPPPGFTKHGHTFPATAAGADLLAAAIGEPGQAVVSAKVPVQAGQGVQVALLCDGLPARVAKSADVWLSVNGHREMVRDAANCARNDDPMDVAFDSRVDLSQGTASVWLGDGKGERIPMPSGTTLGVAFYTAAHLDASAVFPERLDLDGHLWQLESKDRSDSDTTGVKASVDSRRGPVVVAWTASEHAHSHPFLGQPTMSLSVDGREAGRSTSGGTGFSMVATGQVSTVQVHTEKMVLDWTALGIYTLVR